MHEIGRTTYRLKFNSVNGRVTVRSELLEKVRIRKDILIEGAMRYFTIKSAINNDDGNKNSSHAISH